MDAQSSITTLLFTDIEGSTRLWEQEPERMRSALARHDAIVRSAVESHGGTVVKLTGDGVCAAFADPLDGVLGVLQLQRALADPAATNGLALRVRSGLHVGAVEFRDGDYFGNPINRAARIMSAAHGGQVLVSQPVVDLLRDRLPEDVMLRDLGTVRLRDLAGPERLHQVVHAALRQDFPALRSLAATPNNLPQQVTSFVGREHELSEARSLLDGARLVTLCGAGGIGKTRLSLQLAAVVLDDYPDGVWFVELAPLNDDRLVAQAVASLVGVKEEAGRSVAEALVKHVAELRLLLILDNCEHLIGACAELADQLLRSGRQLRIVASSRERLHVAGESVYPVPALAVPDDQSPLDAGSLGQFEAVRLFSERVIAATPSFKLTPQNSAAVISICRQLDGIPLAIELAAARTRALSVENLAARLGDRFRLLTTGNRTALPRQQTLRALIDWSYDLLDEQERRLFRRLAVFAGGWTLDAAEAVGAGGNVATTDVLDMLSALVEKSLVIVDVDRGRYGLLETMRQYAAERLEESGKRDEVQARHLDFYLALAERTRPLLDGPEQIECLARLDPERENFLAAHAWAVRTPGGEGQVGLRLAYAFGSYWFIRGQPGLAVRLAEEALARPDAQDRNTARCRALFEAGQQCCFTGRYEQAQRLLEESLAIARELNDRGLEAKVLQPLAMSAFGRDDLATARRYLQEAVELARGIGDKRELAAALIGLAQVHRIEGNLDLAEPLYGDAVTLLREIGDRQNVAIGLVNLAMVSIGQGSGERARRMLIEVVTIAVDIGSKPVGQSALDVAAGYGAWCGEWKAAARLFGAAQEQIAATGLQRDPADDAFLLPLIDQAREALGNAAFESAERSGRELSYENVMQEVRSWLLRLP